MKLFFNKNDLKSYTMNDSNVKLGIGWYRHHPNHKWWGLTVEFYLLFWLVSANFVSNWTEYDKKVNYYRQPEYKKKQEEKLTKYKKKQEEKLAKWKASQDKK